MDNLLLVFLLPWIILFIAVMAVLVIILLVVPLTTIKNTVMGFINVINKE